MSPWKSLAAAAALSLAALSAQAADYTVGDMTITNAWTRATPPNARAGGGFVEIINNGPNADRLLAVRSETAPRVELHEMTVTDGVMKMREMEDGIAIPAGETVTLKPGGLHIMFMGLSEGFEEGGNVPLVLTFETAGDVEIVLPIAKMGARSMDHANMKHNN